MGPWAYSEGLGLLRNWDKGFGVKASAFHAEGMQRWIFRVLVQTEILTVAVSASASRLLPPPPERYITS